ncbi:hypothetical protein F4819DRAFT_480540, partial [Hypoxylon fuscum]
MDVIKPIPVKPNNLVITNNSNGTQTVAGEVRVRTQLFSITFSHPANTYSRIDNRRRHNFSQPRGPHSSEISQRGGGLIHFGRPSN